MSMMMLISSGTSVMMTSCIQTICQLNIFQIQHNTFVYVNTTPITSYISISTDWIILQISKKIFRINKHNFMRRIICDWQQEINNLLATKTSTFPTNICLFRKYISILCEKHTQYITKKTTNNKSQSKESTTPKLDKRFMRAQL